MSIPILLFAAGAVAGQNVGASTLSCDLTLPDGSRFQVEGYFDESGLHTNLSTLIQSEGVFVPDAHEAIVVSDGTSNHRWQLQILENGQKFNAFLTQYFANQHGLPAPTAVLRLESQRRAGRHWGRSLVGVGLCDIRPGQSDEQAS
jgi:hypothetical protein